MKRGSSSSGSRSRSRREQQMLATKMLLMMLLHQVLAMITHRNETQTKDEDWLFSILSKHSSADGWMALRLAPPSSDRRN
jgi:hypothetical protein